MRQVDCLINYREMGGARPSEMFRYGFGGGLDSGNQILSGVLVKSWVGCQVGACASVISDLPQCGKVTVPLSLVSDGGSAAIKQWQLSPDALD